MSNIETQHWKGEGIVMATSEPNKSFDEDHGKSSKKTTSKSSGNKPPDE